MIKLNTFAETIAAMKEGRIPYIVGQEYLRWAVVEENIPTEVARTEEELRVDCAESYRLFDWMRIALDQEYGDDATFDYMNGGELCICESEEDLKQILG